MDIKTEFKPGQKVWFLDGATVYYKEVYEVCIIVNSIWARQIISKEVNENGFIPNAPDRKRVVYVDEEACMTELRRRVVQGITFKEQE